MPTPTTHVYEVEDTLFSNGCNSPGLHAYIEKSTTVSIKCLGVEQKTNEQDGKLYAHISMADDLEEIEPEQLTALEALLPLHDVNYVSPVVPTQVEVSNPGPLTSDDRRILQVNHVPAGEYFWGTGAFDDFDPTAPASGRGEGDQIVLETNGDAGNVDTISGRFFEYVYIMGGSIYASGGAIRDHISLVVTAPASSPVADLVTGNVVAAPTGLGFNVWIPCAEGSGTHRVDGNVFEQGQCNQDLCPVPASEDANGDGTGLWDWDPSLAPAATIIPNALGKGRFNLYDVALPLARQANRYPILVPYQNVTPEAAVKAKKILPHWLWTFTLVRGPEVGVAKVAVRLDTARTQTA